MPTIAVIGLQWGDEGKGKIIDLLASKAKAVVRAQGGHNAGHSVVTDKGEFHFHLIPSGILYPHVVCYIGGGTVIDPRALLAEIKQLEESGIPCKDRLFISNYAHLIFPYHQLLDQLMEKEKGIFSIGTTGRGIGPCYVDAVGRIGIRIGELIDSEIFKKRLATVLPTKNRELERLYGNPPIEFELLYKEYLSYADQLKGFVVPVEEEIQKVISTDNLVLFEGAQGALLDVTFGTYPFVTSSCTRSGGLSLGAGVGPKGIDHTLGILKAYSTRVGNGPFPTELSVEERALFLSPKEAREVGTTTGRIRRLGWLDIVLVKYALRMNSVDAIALTKLDILDSLDRIKICTGYKFRGEVVKVPPTISEYFEEVEPIYEILEGWKKITTQFNSVEELPKNARIFLARLEELIDVPVEIISYGPEREKTWMKKKL